MALPATGTSWKAGGFAEVDSRFYSRGPLAAVLIRDNRGADTDISPYKAGTPNPVQNWSPFAQDGQLRDDLFAQIRVDGEWVVNETANEGWWLIGALDDKGGPERKGAIKHDDAMILQSNWPFDTDLTGEGLTISFTGVEVFKPALKRLRMNLPLSDTDGVAIVEDIGEDGFVLSKPVDAESIDRQLLLVFARRKAAGKMLYSVEGYPLARLTDIGNFKRSKTDADAASLTYTMLPDPYHVDIDPSDPVSGDLVQVLYSEWMGGDAWADMAVTSSGSS